MKIVCDSAQLSEACQNVQRAASSKAAIPAVEGILLSTINGLLTITGYDLEMGVITDIPARIEEEGKIVLNAHMLSETLRKLPEHIVSIDCDSRNIASISSGEFESTLVGFSADDYPELPSVSGGRPITISQDILKDMVRKTIFSVSVKDTGKIVHTGVKFEIEKNHIRLVAVDGIRLAIRNETIKYDGEDFSFVVPAKTLSEVLKLMNEEDMPVDIAVGKKHIIFSVDKYVIISRLLDGEFLNYKAAIPASSKTVVKVDTKRFTDSIDRTSLLITEKIKCPVKCLFKDDMIKISSVTSIGSANDKIYASVEGSECTIGFNNKYMLDALKAVDTDEIKVLLDGPVRPILITPLEGDSFLFLILPVRLKDED